MLKRRTVRYRDNIREAKARPLDNQDSCSSKNKSARYAQNQEENRLIKYVGLRYFFPHLSRLVLSMRRASAQASLNRFDCEDRWLRVNASLVRHPQPRVYSAPRDLAGHPLPLSVSSSVKPRTRMGRGRDNRTRRRSSGTTDGIPRDPPREVANRNDGRVTSIAGQKLNVPRFELRLEM